MERYIHQPKKRPRGVASQSACSCRYLRQAIDALVAVAATALEPHDSRHCAHRPGAARAPGARAARWTGTPSTKVATTSARLAIVDHGWMALEAYEFSHRPRCKPALLPASRRAAASAGVSGWQIHRWQCSHARIAHLRVGLEAPPEALPTPASPSRATASHPAAWRQLLVVRHGFGLLRAT